MFKLYPANGLSGCRTNLPKQIPVPQNYRECLQEVHLIPHLSQLLQPTPRNFSLKAVFKDLNKRRAVIGYNVLYFSLQLILLNDSTDKA